MTTIRRLTPITADNRRYARISEPKQRRELLDHVLCTLIQRTQPPESDEEFMARAEKEVDRMSIQWRTFSDLEMRQRQQRSGYTSDYDPIASVWAGR